MTVDFNYVLSERTFIRTTFVSIVWNFPSSGQSILCYQNGLPDIPTTPIIFSLRRSSNSAVTFYRYALLMSVKFIVSAFSFVSYHNKLSIGHSQLGSDKSTNLPINFHN